MTAAATRTAEPEAPLLYAPAEAARLLGISRAAIYDLMSAGHLRSISLGRARRIHRAELERIAKVGAAA